MKSWIIVGLTAACLSVGAYLVTAKKPTAGSVASPASQSRLQATPPEKPAAAPAKPAPPVVLADVVEVTDLDPLLDPPARPVVGAPFDAEAAVVPASAPAAPDRIPPAADEPAVAPLPPGAVVVPVFGPGGQLLGIRYFF